jgi:hypothetical protein
MSKEPALQTPSSSLSQPLPQQEEEETLQQTLSEAVSDGVKDRPLSRLEKQWRDFFVESFTLWTLTIGILIGFFILHDTEAGAELGFTEEEAEKLAPSAGRILAKHIKSEKVRSVLFQSDDYIVVCLVLVSYFARVGQAWREKGVQFGPRTNIAKEVHQRQRAASRGETNNNGIGDAQSIAGITPTFVPPQGSSYRPS